MFESWDDSQVRFWLSVAKFSAIVLGFGSACVTALTFVLSNEKDHRSDKEKEALRLRISENEATTAKALEGSAKLGVELSHSNERIAESNKVAAQLRLELEREVAGRQPRTFSEVQVGIVKAALRKLSSRGKIAVFANPGDPEGILFSERLIDVLRELGFEAVEWKSLSAFIKREGQFMYHSPDSIPSYIAPLQTAFEKAGLLIIIDPHMPPNLPAGCAMAIGVGPKSFAPISRNNTPRGMQVSVVKTMPHYDSTATPPPP